MYSTVALLYAILIKLCLLTPRGGGLPYERGGDARVSLRGVNFGFWSHLGCSGQNAIIFSPKGLF